MGSADCLTEGHTGDVHRIIAWCRIRGIRPTIELMILQGKEVSPSTPSRRKQIPLDRCVSRVYAMSRGQASLLKTAASEFRGRHNANSQATEPAWVSGAHGDNAWGPKVKNYGLSPLQVSEVKKVMEERRDEIISSWDKHFRSGSH